MKSTQELLIHAPLIKLGFNVVPPSTFVVDNEEKLFPNEKVRDAYYNIAGDIAELSLNDRFKLIKALERTLLTPIQTLTFDDFDDEWITDLIMFLSRNPQFKEDSSDSDKIKKFISFLQMVGERESKISEFKKSFENKLRNEISRLGEDEND